MVVRGLNEHSITEEVIRFRTVLIPRIQLWPSDPTIPFELSRSRSLIKTAFAMTVNTAHGQKLKLVGVYLLSPMGSSKWHLREPLHLTTLLLQIIEGH